MHRVLWFLPVGLLIVFAGYVGFRMGQSVTETEIITGIANHYAQSHGGDPADCIGRQGTADGVFVEVICLNADGVGYAFDVNERGRLLATRRMTGQMT